MMNSVLCRRKYNGFSLKQVQFRTINSYLRAWKHIRPPSFQSKHPFHITKWHYLTKENNTTYPSLFKGLLPQSFSLVRYFGLYLQVHLLFIGSTFKITTIFLIKRTIINNKIQIHTTPERDYISQRGKHPVGTAQSEGGSKTPPGTHRAAFRSIEWGRIQHVSA